MPTGSLCNRREEIGKEIENMAMITALINYMVSLEEGGAGSPAGAALSGFTSRWREFGKRNGVKGI